MTKTLYRHKADEMCEVLAEVGQCQHLLVQAVLRGIEEIKLERRLKGMNK